MATIETSNQTLLNWIAKKTKNGTTNKKQYEDKIPTIHLSMYNFDK